MGTQAALKKTVNTPSRKVALASPPPPAPSAFAKLFFSNVSPSDLESLPDAVQQQLAASMWQLAQKRPRGSVNIRVFNPKLERNGWSFGRTVVEIVNDDMSFLVDSVTSELQRRGLMVHLSIHPIVHTQRDSKGNLIDLKGDKKTAESFIHIHVDRLIDEEQLEEIESSLRGILSDVRTVVTDWSTMQGKVQAIIDEIAHSVPRGISEDEAEETKLFLQWLNDRNYTFLGYRKLDLLHNKDTYQWKIVANSGLGILRNEDERIFGRLRDLKTQPPEVVRLLKQKRLTIVAKTNARSRVHRGTPMDAVFIQRFNNQGIVIGEHMFIGLFTSASYLQSSLKVPYLRRKIQDVLEKTKFDLDSHDGRALMHILDTYPRDELFQIETDDLYSHALGIVQLQERARVALFMRKDPFGRFMTCLIYVPRDRYDTETRQKIQKRLESALKGKMTMLNIRIDDSPLARVFMTIEIQPDLKFPNRSLLEAELREICRSWPDRLKDSLMVAFDETQARHLFTRYGEAFPHPYTDATSSDDAVKDIDALEHALTENKFVIDLSEIDDSGLLRLKLFLPENPLVLSNILPLIENMGLKARHMGGPYEVVPCDGCAKLYIHEFVCSNGSGRIADFSAIKPVFEEAFVKLCSGETENDAFNALTLRARLTWHEITMLRALARYLRQLRIPYDQDMMAATLLSHPQTTRYLTDLFIARHDPHLQGDRAKLMAKLADKILAALENVTVLEEDRIIRRYLNLIESSLRTNYFQHNIDGTAKPYLSIKFDSRSIEFMPLPKPLYEIFVYSPRVEAIHLRGGKVARGGIRWSDRRDDFRNEILGLMKAQMVKNTVIVPVGSKGGFIVKQPPHEADKWQAEGIACYRIFMRGLLDLTDNRVNGRIVPPANVVRHDADDPYLVVAADKGTATFSDIANGISQEYGFWLDDAFASGGSAGYDHKDMGITARGVWEGVKRHFRELGKDIQTTDFTVVGVGDMSGDVFGNGMLLSKHIRLIGAFDHRHIFCDPNPDSAVSFAERQRLFKLSRSSWMDYDKSKLSKGGSIYARSDKTIKLTPEIKKAFELTHDTVTPNDLIQAMLRARVELLYFGGIGTYVKSADETHTDVRDRNNDAIRIDGHELHANVVGEGANLGMTQLGRIEYALKGGRLNTDFIDNSAGVATSDREVNIKILLSKPMKNGNLSLPSRNKLLASMTDDVAFLVLRDNYRQTQALSVAETRAAELLPVHARSIRFLEKSGLLNRAIEYLPDDADIAERQRLGKGFTRPELAILLSYAKIWLYDQLLASDLPDDPFLHQDLLYYFPDNLKKKFTDEILHHQLRREIVATRLTNSLINRVGSHFVFAVADQTGQNVSSIARAYHLARAAFDLHALWKDIESLDNKVPASTQTTMLLTINRMMDYVVPWLLNQGEVPQKLEPAIARFSKGVEQLTAWFVKNPSAIGDSARKMEEELIAHGVSNTLARRIAIMPYLAIAPELTRLASQSECNLENAAAVFFGLGERLHLEWLRERVAHMSGPDTPWKREATSALLGDVLDSQRRLTHNALVPTGKKAKACSKEELLAHWINENALSIEKFDLLIDEIKAAGNLDMAMLTLASRHLSALSR